MCLRFFLLHIFFQLHGKWMFALFSSKIPTEWWNIEEKIQICNIYCSISRSQAFFPEFNMLHWPACDGYIAASGYHSVCMFYIFYLASNGSGELWGLSLQWWNLYWILFWRRKEIVTEIGSTIGHSSVSRGIYFTATKWIIRYLITIVRIQKHTYTWRRKKWLTTKRK